MEHGRNFVFFVEPSSAQKTFVASFRNEDGEVNTRGLASAILNEVDTDGWVLVSYLSIFLEKRVAKSGDEGLTYRQTLDLLSSIVGGEGGDFVACLLYQKIFPKTTSSEFMKILKSGRLQPMRTEDRYTNLYLYSLENLLGFPKGSMCDMNRK